MKKILLATVALSALAGSALAADLPYRSAPPVAAPAFVAVPVFTWSGFYAGVNAGYGFSGESNATTTGYNDTAVGWISSGQTASGAKLDRNGFVGGGQIGYNYQMGNLVLGLETDIQGTDLTKKVVWNDLRGNYAGYRASTTYLGTVRGRLGYAMDRWMIYATGGLAYGNVKLGHVDGDSFGPIASGNRSGTDAGFTVGAGVEYALPAFNWGGSAATVKLEYLYYDLGKRSVVSTDAFGTPYYKTNFNNDGHIVRAGLNWKFSAY